MLDLPRVLTNEELILSNFPIGVFAMEVMSDGVDGIWGCRKSNVNFQVLIIFDSWPDWSTCAA